MEYILDTDSEEYRRVTAAGFTMRNLNVSYDELNKIYNIGVEFTCVCGNTEFLSVAISEETKNSWFDVIKVNKINVAAIIELAGSTSISHLVDDGFDEDAICNIRKAYNEDENFVREKVRLFKSFSQKVAS